MSRKIELGIGDVPEKGIYGISPTIDGDLLEVEWVPPKGRGVSGRKFVVGLGATGGLLFLTGCVSPTETPVVRTPEEAGLTPSPTLEIRTPTPETIPTPTPTEVRPLPTPTIENIGFGLPDLTAKERQKLDELTEIYSQEASYLTQRNNWSMDHLKIYQTHGSQEGIVGAYLVYDEDRNFTDTPQDQRYWQANEGGEVVEVPKHQEEAGTWNREKNRFEWEEVFFNPESQKIMKIVFTDDFSQNRGWRTSEALRISDGNLTILNQEGWLREYNWRTKFGIKGDFRVEAQMGVKFGQDQNKETDLVLGIPGRASWDDGKFYDIVLLPDGVAVRALDGTTGKLENWILNKGVNAQVLTGERFNQLVVERRGEKFIVYLNGKNVMEFNDILFSGGEFPLTIGFNVAPGTKLEADNLEVSSPFEKPIEVITPTPAPIPTLAPSPTETPSPPICEIPHFPDRTPERKNGITFDRDSGQSGQLIRPEGIPTPPHFQWMELRWYPDLGSFTKRDGRITAIDRENQIITFDLGGGLVVQRRFTENTHVFMWAHEAYRGMPATESLQRGGNFCDLEVGDAASILHPSGEEGANPNPTLTDLWGVNIVQQNTAKLRRLDKIEPILQTENNK